MMIAELIAAAFGTSQNVTIATAAVSAAPTRAETRLNTFLVMVNYFMLVMISLTTSPTFMAMSRS